MARIGKMRSRITLCFPVETELPGGSGRTDWVIYDNIWAEFIPISGRRSEQDSQMEMYEGATVRIRYTTSFTPDKNAILWHKDKSYTINSVQELYDRSRFWELKVFTTNHPVS